MVLVLLNLSATGLDIWGLDDMMLQDNSEVEMKYPTLCERFFSTPGLYLQGVLAFRGGIVTEGTLTDRQLMNSALKTIINSIRRDTKFSFDNQVTDEKDSKSALVKAFNPAVHAAASSGLSWGSAREMDIATKLNLESVAKLRNSVADVSDSNIKVGTQVGKLSK